MRGGATLGQQTIDLNNDGMFDTVRREVRLHQTDPVISRIVLVSGVDQVGWLSIPTKTPNDMFGWYVSPIGDFDGDAVEDLAVTAPASLIADGLGPEEPGGPIPAWRGRVVLISAATGIELMTLYNPESTADAIFGLGAAAVPDQDADGLPDILVAGIGMIPAPTPEDPSATASGWMWWVMSTATTEPIRMGTGPVGSPGCEFLLPGESPHQFWAENLAAGALEFLPGLAGDLDGDGDVDEGDTNVFLEELSNTAQGSTRVGDLNGDGVLGIADLAVLLQQMGLSADMMESIDPNQMLNALRQAGDNHFNNTGQFTTGPQCPWIWLGNCQGGGMAGLFDDPGGGGGGCPGCVPTPCTGPCCNNPDPCCSNPCACDFCACHPCSLGCWTPDCSGSFDCDDCDYALSCDSDGDGWVDAWDCDSSCCLLAASACDCSAEIWQIRGPSFVGVNQPFTLYSHWHWSGVDLNEWQILSGGNLLTWSIQPTTPYRMTATAGSAPGVVQVRIRGERYGKVCESIHTVHIVEYAPITVRYTAFIPCQILEGPPGGHGFYAGDDRSFSATASNYRVGYHKTIAVSDHMPPSPNDVPLFNDAGFPIFGTSYGYLPAAGIASTLVAGCPWRLAPGAVEDVWTTLIPNGQNWRFSLEQVAFNSVLVRIHANASNPAYPFESPPIRVEMKIDMAQVVNPNDGTQGMPYVHIFGSRTFFPAHEAWINEHSIHRYNPIPQGTNPIEGLFNFREIFEDPTAFALP